MPTCKMLHAANKVIKRIGRRRDVNTEMPIVLNCDLCDCLMNYDYSYHSFLINFIHQD